jgi:hypothetical protein
MRRALDRAGGSNSLFSNAYSYGAFVALVSAFLVWAALHAEQVCPVTLPFARSSIALTVMCGFSVAMAGRKIGFV